MVDSVILKTVQWAGEEKYSEKRSLSEERSHRGAGAVHSTGEAAEFPEDVWESAQGCGALLAVGGSGRLAWGHGWWVVPYTWASQCPFPAGEVLGSRGSCDFPGSLEAWVSWPGGYKALFLSFPLLSLQRFIRFFQRESSFLSLWFFPFHLWYVSFVLHNNWTLVSL